MTSASLITEHFLSPTLEVGPAEVLCGISHSSMSLVVWNTVVKALLEGRSTVHTPLSSLRVLRTPHNSLNMSMYVPKKPFGDQERCQGMCTVALVYFFDRESFFFTARATPRKKSTSPVTPTSSMGGKADTIFELLRPGTLRPDSSTHTHSLPGGTPAPPNW